MLPLVALAFLLSNPAMVVALCFVVSVPYRVSEDMNGIRKIHLDNFAGNDKVCFVKDRAENEEGFYSYEQSGLGKQQGYYIYYEKNEKMKKYWRLPLPC